MGLFAHLRVILKLQNLTVQTTLHSAVGRMQIHKMAKVELAWIYQIAKVGFISESDKQVWKCLEFEKTLPDDLSLFLSFRLRLDFTT